MKVERKRLSPPDKRQKIVEAAATQFLRLGYDGCTLDLVAARAKVGKQAIYQFFAGKEDLYAEVVRAELAQRTITEPPPCTPAERALEQYLFDTINRTAMPRTHGLMRINILASRRHPALAAELHEGMRQGAWGLARLLTRLEAEGALQPLRSDPFNLATRLGGVATEGARHLLGFKWTGGDRARDMARWTAGLFLHGCPCDGGPNPSQPGEQEREVVARRPMTMRLDQERFENLCAVAMDAFLADGFNGTNVDDLVTRTGVSRATIYRQFGNKLGFFRFLIEREIGRDAILSVSPSPSTDFAAGLLALAGQLLRRHLSSRSIGMHHLLIQEVGRLPDLARIFYESRVELARAPLEALYRLHGRHGPCDHCVRAFYTLATFGVRFLARPTDLDDAEIFALSGEVAAFMAGNLTVADPHSDAR